MLNAASNSRPSDYETDAPPTALTKHISYWEKIFFYTSSFFSQFLPLFYGQLFKLQHVQACVSSNLGYHSPVQYYLVLWDFSIVRHSNSEFTCQLSCILNVNSSKVIVVGIQPQVGWDIAWRYVLYVFLSSGQFLWPKRETALTIKIHTMHIVTQYLRPLLAEFLPPWCSNYLHWVYRKVGKWIQNCCV